MLVRLQLELEDKPGQLVRALEPIARYGGNIQSILHLREQKTPLGRLPVTLIFEIQEREKLEKILDALRKADIRIVQIGEREWMHRTTVLLLGHVVHAGLQQIVDRLNSMGKVRVSDVSLAMRGPGAESAARLSLIAEDPTALSQAVLELEGAAGRMGLLLVKRLEE